MRYIRYLILIAIAVVLVTVALANRGTVTINLVPEDLSLMTGVAYSVTLPLFVVICGSVAFGVLLGFVWEWVREHKHRAEAAHERREHERLERELRKLKTRNPAAGDDVLELLEGSSRT